MLGLGASKKKKGQWSLHGVTKKARDQVINAAIKEEISVALCLEHILNQELKQRDAETTITKISELKDVIHSLKQMDKRLQSLEKT